MEVPQLDEGFAVVLERSRQANTAYHYEAGLSAARQALSLADPADHEQLAEVHSNCAVALFNLGLMREAEREFDAALQHYDALDDLRHVVWCQVRIAWCSHTTGDLPRALHLASLALAEARGNGWLDLEAKALVAIGNVAWKRGDRRAALGDLTRAAELFQRQGMVDARQRTLATIGYVTALDGRLDEGRALIEESLSYYQRVGDVIHVIKVTGNLAFVHYAKGELHAARDILLQASELCNEWQSLPAGLSIWYNLGLIELHLERHSAAKKCLLRARQMAIQFDDNITENLALLHLGVLKIYDSLPAEALELFELCAKNLSGSAGDEVSLTAYYIAVGQLATAQVDQARATWQACLPVAQLLDCLDDFRMLVRVLEFIGSAEYQPPQALPTPAIDLAVQWRGELLAEIPPD